MQYTYLSERNAEKIEGCLGILTSVKGFILNSNAGNENPGLFPVNLPQTAPVRNSPIVPFSGQGVRLGGDSVPQSRKYQQFSIDEENEL